LADLTSLCQPINLQSLNPQAALASATTAAPVPTTLSDSVQECPGAFLDKLLNFNQRLGLGVLPHTYNDQVRQLH